MVRFASSREVSPVPCPRRPGPTFLSTGIFVATAHERGTFGYGVYIEDLPCIPNQGQRVLDVAGVPCGSHQVYALLLGIDSALDYMMSARCRYTIYVDNQDVLDTLRRHWHQPNHSTRVDVVLKDIADKIAKIERKGTYRDAGVEIKQALAKLLALLLAHTKALRSLERRPPIATKTPVAWTESWGVRRPMARLG